MVLVGSLFQSCCIDNAGPTDEKTSVAFMAVPQIVARSLMAKEASIMDRIKRHSAVRAHRRGRGLISSPVGREFG